MCRYFLGVNKYTPNVAIQGDMGLRVPWQHQWIEIIRQWCRVHDMQDVRLNKRIYIWSKDVRGSTWYSRLVAMLHKTNLSDYLIHDSINKDMLISDLKEKLENMFYQKWSAELFKLESKSKKGNNKLRTYNTFKKDFVSECYVFTTMPRCHRSAMAQIRCGTAPIRLETGRYEGIPVEQRTCPLCKEAVEDELHIILECPVYNDVRHELLNKLMVDVNVLFCYSKPEILKLILGCTDESHVKLCARACFNFLELRRKKLYN